MVVNLIMGLMYSNAVIAMFQVGYLNKVAMILESVIMQILL